ncbi:MAG: hypothetical protein K2G99_03050, partial [Desulfovibrio sp.]|nr:hypothetical protein [Desulfovibrio sp.]
MLYSSRYPSPLGELFLAATDQALVGLWLERQPFLAATGNEHVEERPEAPVLALSRQWLDAYFAGIPYDLKLDNENNFHHAFYVLTTPIGIDAKAEVHTSDGRIDLLIETPKYI